MTRSAPCQPQTLARDGNLRVDLCGCGQIHLTIGALTVRLERDDFSRLCDAMLTAARQLPLREPEAQLH
jgi:hypothetical protein